MQHSIKKEIELVEYTAVHQLENKFISLLTSLKIRIAGYFKILGFENPKTILDAFDIYKHRIDNSSINTSAFFLQLNEQLKAILFLLCNPCITLKIKRYICYQVLQSIHEDGEISCLAEIYHQLLLETIHHKEFNFAKKLLVNPCVTDKIKSELFLEFCSRGDRAGILFLSKIPGVDVNYRNDDNEYPLYIAITDSNLEMLRIIKTMPGLDPNQLTASKEFISPLFYAVKIGNVEIVKELLTFAGVNIHLHNNQKDTPLHIAVRLNLLRIVRALLEVGANINKKNNMEETPLEIAEDLEHQRIFFLLKKENRMVWKMNLKIYQYLLQVKRICIPFDTSKVSQTWLNSLSLLIKFQTALDYVRATLAIGANNRIEDIEKTAGWVSNQEARYNTTGEYLKREAKDPPLKDQFANVTFDATKRVFFYKPHKWYFQSDGKGYQPDINVGLLKRHAENPLFDRKFKLSKSHYYLLLSTILSSVRRQGNCGDRSLLIMKYLWEHKEGIHRLEYVATKTFDHCMVLVNRSGDLNNPKTWGNAWIIDAWYKEEGIIFPAAAFARVMGDIKKYAKKQMTELKGIIRVSPVEEGIEKLNPIVKFQILPDIDIYPTYSTAPLRPVESYYTVLSEYPKNLHQDREILPVIESLASHKILFKPVLDVIREKKFKLAAVVPEKIVKKLNIKHKRIDEPPETTLFEKPITHTQKIFKPTVPRKSLSKQNVNKIGISYLRKNVL